MEQPRSHVLNQSQRLYSVVVRLSCVPTKQITRREMVDTRDYEVLGQCKELLLTVFGVGHTQMHEFKHCSVFAAETLGPTRCKFFQSISSCKHSCIFSLRKKYFVSNKISNYNYFLAIKISIEMYQGLIFMKYDSFITCVLLLSYNSFLL